MAETLSLSLLHFQGTELSDSGRNPHPQFALGADTSLIPDDGKFGTSLEIPSYGLVQAGMTVSIPRMRLDTGAWTLDFWYRAGAGYTAGDDSDLISFVGDSGVFSMINAQRNGANFDLERGANTLVTMTYTNAKADYNHIALVKLGGFVFIYENGVGTVTLDLATFGLTTDEYTTFAIGTGTDTGGVDFCGNISEVRFTDAAKFIGDFTPETQPYFN